jgi:hypothetical protein
MSTSTKKGDRSSLPSVEAWENEGGATAPRPASVLSKLAMQAIFNEWLSTKSGSGLDCVDVSARRPQGAAVPVVSSRFHQRLVRRTGLQRM